MDDKSFPRGFQVLGENVTQYQKDWHEAIDFYKEIPHTEAERGVKPFCHPNLFPENPREFKPIIQRYIEEMKTLGQKIMKGLALGVGLEENYFIDNFTSDTFWVMRMIGYPPLNTASVDGVGVSCGEHCDYGWLTIVNQDSTASALRVRNKAGDYINAEPIPGTFVMNIGDMLKVWSNGVYQSTPHKVINNCNQYRVSIPFFYEPNFDAVIEPYHLFVNEQNPPKFKRVVYGDHLTSKVMNNFGPPPVGQ